MSKPLGPYTPTVRAGDFIIISGQGGLLDGTKVDGGLGAETQQAMKNIEALLATMGASMSDVVKTTCFLLIQLSWPRLMSQCEGSKCNAQSSFPVPPKYSSEIPLDYKMNAPKFTKQ